MDSKKMFQDIYKDFFGEDVIVSSTEPVKEEIEELELDVNSLHLKESSKELLNKIIAYMGKYNQDKKNYIPFNIILKTNDKETIANVLVLLKHFANKYHYCEKNNIKNISLYKINEENINKVYEENSVIALGNLDGIGLNDLAFKMKFFYDLKENINKNKITVIYGNDTKVKEFLINDDDLSDAFQNFVLEEEKPNANEVYNKVIEELEVSDENKIKLLDYIGIDYEKSNLDFTSYVNNLKTYISFNNNVPELPTEKSLEDTFKELNELVGLQNVKDTLNDLVDLINLKNKTKGELKINNVNLHMVFLGNPGTGKTTVARLLANILYDLKYIKQNKLVEVSSKDLVAEYVGQTAVKTMNVVEKAMGGVLFIDEAYSLSTVNNDNGFNGECIATLIKAMEDYRDNLVVIFAGYTKEMQDFLNSNSGITSRIGYTMTFEDYTNEELKQIFKGMVTKAGFVLEDGTLDKLDELIDANRNSKNFGNARFIRTVYEKTVINHASNTSKKNNNKILRTITKNDICY